MAAGDATFDLLLLQTDAGVAQSYANAAAFLLAGWELEWRDGSGAALSPQPTYTVSDEGGGVHRVAYDEPEGPSFVAITVPAGFYTPTIALIRDGDTFDVDGIMSQLLATDGTASAGAGSARVSTVLEDWIDGDSFALRNVQISTVALAKIGKTDLTGVTVLAAAKLLTDDSDDAPEIVFDVDVVSIPTRVVDITLDEFPVAAAVADGVRTIAYAMDVSIKNDADDRIYTARRYTFNIAWQADTATS